MEDTIAAISTPPGRGAISIIRLSGTGSFDIIKKIFKSKEAFDSIAIRKAVFGKIYDEKQLIDEVIIIKFVSSNSYTNEDMVEINCHGSSYISERILELILRKGARLADPGEFTLRAFLNGRLDLSRAEAVADLIQSQTEISHKTSLNQLEGFLSKKISQIRDQILDSTSLLELELDFSEEDVEFVNREELISKIKDIIEKLNDLIATYRAGRIAREGIKLVITGKPNVGKSSLLNQLIKDEKAIVTDIPGTTRDALEVQLDIRGILFRIVDTAGLIKTDDPIEKEGIQRAEKHLRSADVIIHLFDGSKKIDKNDYKIINKLESISGKKIIRVVNKADLPQKLNISELSFDGVQMLSISALTGSGIKDVENVTLRAVLDEENPFSQQAVVTSVRHLDALKKARSNLDSTIEEIEKGVSSEFVSIFLRDALDCLGQITGIVTSENILENIFSKFCIGK